MPAGLGDIAVPGLLACLALRFDLSKLLAISTAGQSTKATGPLSKVVSR